MVGDGLRDTPVVYETNITFTGGVGSIGDVPMLEITPTHFRNQTTLSVSETVKGASSYVQEVQVFTVTRTDTDSASTKADAPRGHFSLQYVKWGLMTDDKCVKYVM